MQESKLEQTKTIRQFQIREFIEYDAVERSLNIAKLRKLRKQMLKKANYKCPKCGSQESLQIHHKDQNPLNSAKTNLMILCRKCHKALHNSFSSRRTKTQN